MTRLGLLLTLTEPPPAMEEEFNAWYDDEHFPERLSIPGFRSAQRWVADLPPGEGKYLATYELDSAAVLSSPAYLERFRNQTPWSKRCLGKLVVFNRWACEQVDPGDAGPHPRAKAIAFALGEEVSFTESLQVRRFLASTGEKIVLNELAQAPAGARVYRSYR